jgi:hypothetical protein
VISAVALLLAGGAIAAVTAVGEGTSKPRHVRAGGRAVSARDLAAASSYLGVPTSELAARLRSGKSLAQIAEATPGRSKSGLIAALVSEKRRRLSTLGAAVNRRVSAEVNRSGPGSVRVGHRRRGAGLGGFASVPNRVADAAAGYLGVPPALLGSELRSGKTLAQVANSTRGKSEAGLVAALVAAKRESISAGLGARRLSPARVSVIEARLTKRVTALVNRTSPGR